MQSQKIDANLHLPGLNPAFAQDQHVEIDHKHHECKPQIGGTANSGIDAQLLPAQ
jgi:hypothetical protein